MSMNEKEKEYLDDQSSDNFSSTETVAFLIPTEKEGKSVQQSPAGDGVYTISDKVHKKIQLQRLKKSWCQCEMLNTPMKRRVCVLLTTFVVTVALLLGFLSVHHHLAARRLARARFDGTCMVRMPDGFGGYSSRTGSRKVLPEGVRIDASHVRVISPSFKSFKGATVLHLFHKRVTVIRTRGICFIKRMRSDLHRSHDLVPLIEKLKRGSYHPRANIVREHWFLSHPAILPAALFFNFDYRVSELCDGVPTHHLVSRSRITHQLKHSKEPHPIMPAIQLMPKSRPFSHCPMARCSQLGNPFTPKYPGDNACPAHLKRRVSVMGCPQQCSCNKALDGDVIRNGFICTPLTKAMCPLSCPQGHELHQPEGCPICRCKLLLMAGRKRRSVAADFNANECKITHEIFEGVVAGDVRELAPVDFIHDCNAE